MKENNTLLQLAEAVEPEVLRGITTIVSRGRATSFLEIETFHWWMKQKKKNPSPMGDYCKSCRLKHKKDKLKWEKECLVLRERAKPLLLKLSIPEPTSATHLYKRNPSQFF